MIKPEIRSQIRDLRSRGLTYGEICSELGFIIPKGTLSYICKDIKLSNDSLLRHRLQLRDILTTTRDKALVANREKLKRRFENIHNQASGVVRVEQNKDYEKICLAMLYIAEGSKYKSYRGLAMGSSDPVILRIYIKLLERCYAKTRDEFRARIQCRDDQDKEKLELYWTHELGLSPSVFYPAYSDKRTVGKPTQNTEYKGVCVVSCKGTDIQLELDAIARLYEKNMGC